MTAGSRFRRHRFFAFAMPSFRLRHVFATPSDRLRRVSCNVLGLSNLGSDSPLDFAHFGQWYLDWIGVLRGSSTLGSVGVSTVVRPNGVAAGLLLHVGSSGQAVIGRAQVMCVDDEPKWHDKPCTTGIAFGPVMGNREEAELFLEQLPLDPARLRRKELMTKYADFVHACVCEATKGGA